MHKVSSFGFSVTADPKSSNLALKDGSEVSVTIVGREKNGTVLIKLGSRLVTASSLPGAICEPGTEFKALVSMRSGKAFLTPLHAKTETFRPVLPGIPNDQLSMHLISLMTRSGMRLDPDRMRSYLKIAAKHPDQAKEAAEAAMLLDGKDIPLNEKSPSPESTPQGSFRFLIDAELKKTLEYAVICKVLDYSWAFRFDSKYCSVSSDPVLSSVDSDKCVVYLKRLLNAVGIADVVYDNSAGLTAPDGVDVYI
ncbi:MAG TPA: hypothetical protein PL077_04820 [Treponemataceae bacterium]|nr:hypothetical protein [Treponemataceae bacterium]